MTTLRRPALCALLLVSIAACPECGSYQSEIYDATALDAATVDAATVDAGAGDATRPDSSAVDARVVDGASRDLEEVDSAAPDSATPDAGLALTHLVIDEHFDGDLGDLERSGGSWSISGEALTLDAPAAVEPLGNLALHGVELFADYWLSASVHVPDETGWDDAAVVLAYQGPDDYLYVSFNELNDPSTSGLFRWDGARTELADITAALSPGVDHAIELRVTPSSVAVLLDGTSVATVSGLSTTAGRVGLATYNNRATFDDLEVRVVPDDTLPPIAPASLQGSALASSARLSWQPASDNISIVGYHLRRDSTELNALPLLWPRYDDPGLAAGTYSYTVEAVDGHGNCSAPSASAQVTVTGQAQWDPGPHITFDQTPLGTYTDTLVRADWPSIAWASVDHGRVSVIEGAEAFSGRSLRVLYPEGGVGPGEGGAQWKMNLPQDYDELYCAFRVKFGAGFDHVLGGKIPGLLGGAGNTGGAIPDGTDGWSARMMWRTGGEAVQYVYHPDQAGTWGESFIWNEGGARVFEPGVWHQVEHRVVMNTPTQHDGQIQGWWDGELALDVSGLRFRDRCRRGSPLPLLRRPPRRGATDRPGQSPSPGRARARALLRSTAQGVRCAEPRLPGKAEV